MKKVPYMTSEDETQWNGHIWRQREYIGGPWGFAWEVFAPLAGEAEIWGWRSTQQQAEKAMQDVLDEKSN